MTSALHFVTDAQLKLNFRHFSIVWAIGNRCEHLSGRWRRNR